MSSERTWFDKTVLGVALLAMGCADDKGADDTDETGTEGDGDGDAPPDPTGDPDTGDGDTGDPVPNDIPLELEIARFNKTGQFLLLRFSEPMAPVDAVDPNDFRVSLATSTRYQYNGYGYNYIYESSRYADPNLNLGYDYYYGGYGFQPLVVEKVANGKKDTDIILRFFDPLEEDACLSFAQLQADYEFFDSLPNQDAMVGLFPHYSPGAVKVKSADGEVLAPIGPEWVEYGYSYMFEDEFGWPHLNPQIEIPCTVGIDP
jgi:hypothetical protein